jgi:hypothetical protein
MNIVPGISVEYRLQITSPPSDSTAGPIAPSPKRTGSARRAKRLQLRRFRNADATPALGRCLALEVASLPQIDVRRGMPPVKLSREEFEKRYRSRFIDPVFRPLDRELNAIVNAAWDAYSNSRKSPVTRKAGPGFADPDYEISVDWLAAREAILAAQRRHDDPSEKPRILLINGSSRSEHTCPGEMSKTWRLIKSSEPIFEEMGFAVDILDLSRLTSESAGKSIPANPVFRPRWRSAIGHAVATRTTRSARPTTG